MIATSRPRAPFQDGRTVLHARRVVIPAMSNQSFSVSGYKLKFRSYPKKKKYIEFDVLIERAYENTRIDYLHQTRQSSDRG